MKPATTLPTQKDISPTEGLDLDEQCALEHFYGLDQSTALKMFRDDADYLHVYLADFVHMGDAGFSYYLPALVQYFDELPDDRFVEDALDASDYVLIRFSDCRSIPAGMDQLVELLQNRLRVISPELVPPLPERVAKILAEYRQSEQGSAHQSTTAL